MTRPLRYLALLALAALGLTGCEQLLTRPILYGTVRAEAHSRSGLPLPGIGVILYTGQRPMGYATTGSDGRATFSRVPPGQYGVFMVLPSEYADLSEFINVPPSYVVDGLDVTSATDTTLRFIFARRGNGAVEAQVRDTDGNSLSGITVTFYNPTGIMGARLTDSAGVARLEPAPFGQYGAFIVPPDSLGVPGLAVVFVDRLAVDRDFVPRAQFVLQRCRGTIDVLALDQSDAPIVGIGVSLYSPASVGRTVATDAVGRVRFADVACGNWGVFLNGLAGFTVQTQNGAGLRDGLLLGDAATLAVTLRATRQ